MHPNNKCQHCKRPLTDHTEKGKCLFAPGKFERRPRTERELHGPKRHVFQRYKNSRYCGTPYVPLEQHITFEVYAQAELDLEASDVCQQCKKLAADDLHAYWKSR